MEKERQSVASGVEEQESVNALFERVKTERKRSEHNW